MRGGFQWCGLSLICACLVGCPEGSPEPSVTGESHWLVVCDQDVDCLEGECLCGACSLACEVDGDCAPVGGEALCAPGGGGCGVSVCALPCEGGCEGDEVCVEGACRVPGVWVCGGAQRVERIGERSELVAGSLSSARSEVEGCRALSPQAQQGPFCADESGVVDLVLIDGEVVHSICSPARSRGVGLEDVSRGEEGGRVIEANAQKPIVAFASDGAPTPGDLRVEASNAALLGAGLAQSVLEGNLTIEGSTARIRGLSVVGDVHLGASANRGALSRVRVHGDLTIEANQTSLVAVEVLGDVLIEGSQGVYVDVGVAGQWVAPEVDFCDGCYAFESVDALLAGGGTGEPVCLLDPEQP